MSLRNRRLCSKWQQLQLAAVDFTVWKLLWFKLWAALQFALPVQQFIVQCATAEDTRNLMAFISKSPGIACYQRVNPETWTQRLPSPPMTPRELESPGALCAKGITSKGIDYDASIGEERSPLVLSGPCIVEDKTDAPQRADGKEGHDSHSLSTLEDDSIPAGVDDVLRSPVVLRQGDAVKGKAAGPLLKRTPRSSRRTAQRNAKEPAPLPAKVSKSSAAAQDDETSTKDSSTRRVKSTGKSSKQSQKCASNTKKNSKSQSVSKSPATANSHPMSLDVADKKMEAGGRISSDKFRQGFVSPKTGKVVFVVRDILGYRRIHHARQYKVAWEGYSDSEATWEPAANIPAAEWKEECADARRKYELENKRRSGVKRPRDPEVLSEFDDGDLIPLD
ncbi:hypothetical protein FOL47_005149 [Perkinsus chesapeaki]|uniref:Chromo domain-containing protein n=1 Tax=Perkinsus chesapeaki TaxID=330153 RepID=A0A7J6LYJ9_PERCH|nr:hypothetical protein FOL47_005149 [Perkinsus chesapeaki]